MDTYCKNCEKEQYFYITSSDYVCGGCGMCADVLLIDDTAEDRRTFADGPDHRHHEIMNEYYGSSTIIGNGRGKLARIQKWLDGSSQATFDSNMTKGLRMITKACYALKCEPAEKEAKAIFEKFMKKTKKEKEDEANAEEKKPATTTSSYYGGYSAASSNKKRITTYSDVNLKPLTLACIFISMKNNRIGMPLRELAAREEILEEDIIKFIKKISNGMAVKRSRGNPADDMIIRITSDLDLGMEIERRSREILTKLAEKMEGKRPATLAATSILIACREQKKSVNMEDLAVCGMCAESTLENTIKQIQKKKIKLSD